MSEMNDRVARAIRTYAVRIWGAPHSYAVIKSAEWDSPIKSGMSCDVAHQEAAKLNAAAAIKALYEPTGRMVLAGYGQLDREVSPHAAEACWKAMIGEVYLLSTPMPVDEEVLPCDVIVAPCTRFEKGVKLSTLLMGIRRRVGRDAGPISECLASTPNSVRESGFVVVNADADAAESFPRPDDFELMLAQVVHRLQKYDDPPLVKLRERAASLLARKGTCSPLRDFAVAARLPEVASNADEI